MVIAISFVERLGLLPEVDTRHVLRHSTQTHTWDLRVRIVVSRYLPHFYC